MFHLIRYGLLGALLLFSLITLGLSASLLSTIPAGDFVPAYLGLDLAIAVITLVVVLPSIVVDFLRKGAFTSLVAVELGWTSVLLILWIAAAGETTAVLTGLSCVFFDDFTGERVNGGAAESVCHQLQALQAFPWLNFIILFAWLVTLIALCVTAHSRGNPGVWTSSVTGTDFRARHGTTAAPQPQTYQQQAPMQQQHTGYSQGYPPAAGTTGYSGTPPPGQQYNPNVSHV